MRSLGLMRRTGIFATLGVACAAPLLGAALDNNNKNKNINDRTPAIAAPKPRRKLDLDLAREPLKAAAPFAFQIKFDPGGPSKTELLFGKSASAALFGLAAVNAFGPGWLPAGVQKVLQGQGRRGAAIPPVYGNSP